MMMKLSHSPVLPWLRQRFPSGDIKQRNMFHQLPQKQSTAKLSCHYWSARNYSMIGAGFISPSALSQKQYHEQLQSFFIQEKQTRYLHLSPREVDHLQLHQVGRLAQIRLARGTKLNHPEAVALIATVLMEHIRDGTYSVAQLMSLGQTLLGTNQVMPGVPALIDSVQIEATFPDGTKLLTIHTPICRPDGNMSEALYGSFLPIPNVVNFSSSSTASSDISPDVAAGEHQPGQVLVDSTSTTDAVPSITINDGRDIVEITVVNTGDRPIQIGSHYAFLETNKALKFDRKLSIGKRLNVPSGSSIRFEPGESKRITLVQMGGAQRILTGNRLMTIVGDSTGSKISTKSVTELTESDKDKIIANLVKLGFQHEPELAVKEQKGQPYTIDRESYNDMYGPTVNDTIRLGDTTLFVRVEKDATFYGDECKFGGGKTLREGMGQATSITSKDALDTVITNALIIDSVTGIIKADIGIKGTSIVGIGKAGNPDIMDNVTPGMIVGNSKWFSRN
jgi:urease